jgi:hypothetical protein
MVDILHILPKISFIVDIIFKFYNICIIKFKKFKKLFNKNECRHRKINN